MVKPVAIIDLFSGPGGLGEGFSACYGPGHRRYQIVLSVEKDLFAHSTLLLRAFLRKFQTGLPSEYYEFLNGAISEPNWPHLYPEEWRAALEETRCLELGKSETTAFLKQKIKQLRDEHGDRTVLIGGPPCQVYSIVGRSRSAGIADYIPHKDERHFLYQKYVEVVASLRPAATVMENVTGMLSSAVKGDSIFRKVMADLRNAAGPDSYRLFALSPSTNADYAAPLPSDFIVRTEEYGIPQARHRVIIVGLRRDIAENLPARLLPRLERREGKVCVADVIGAMPTLRSHLSRGDSTATWKAAIRKASELVKSSSLPLSLPPGIRNEFLSAVSSARKVADGYISLSSEEHGCVGLPDSCPVRLRDWISDERLEKLPNNETRAHMPADLARYLFAAAFGRACKRTPLAADFPPLLAPNHKNWRSGKFADRFRVQLADQPSTTITSHISKDGHYFIHPDPSQCRSLTVREAARLQTFPDNYFFKGSRTQQYIQVGNAVPPYLALQIAESLWKVLEHDDRTKGDRGGRIDQRLVAMESA